MSTSENPAANANEAETALRALAHATRSIDDPRQIYAVLGSLGSAVAAFRQSVHQLAAFHDGDGKTNRWVADDAGPGRTSRHHVVWELHRVGEILGQVEESLAVAHSAESAVTYIHRDFPDFTRSQAQSVDHGVSL